MSALSPSMVPLLLGAISIVAGACVAYGIVKASLLYSDKRLQEHITSDDAKHRSIEDKVSQLTEVKVRIEYMHAALSSKADLVLVESLMSSMRDLRAEMTAGFLRLEKRLERLPADRANDDGK